MNTPQPQNNNGRYLNSRHPLDHIDALPKEGDESIDRICQVLGRTFEWVAEADEPSEKGLRAAVVLYCVRSDLIGKESLTDLACSFNFTVKDLETLVLNFKRVINSV
jgi:hypothetical protein